MQRATNAALRKGVMPLHSRLKIATGRQLWESGLLPPLPTLRPLFLHLPPNVPSGLGWVDENAMEHRFTMFVQTAVGKMMLDHAPHHCTVHLPAVLPFELPHVKAKVAEKEYATVEEDIAKYKCREVHWKDFVWPLWQLSRLHEMAHLDPEAEPLPLSPLSFRETVCGRDTHEFLHHVEAAVQAQLLRLPRDKELTHEKAVHGKTSNHLSPEKMQRGIAAEKAAAKDLWLYPQLGTDLCPATAEFVIDDTVLNVSATTDPRRHWEKGLTELFAYAALARQQGMAVGEVGLFYPFSRHLVHVPIHDWDHRPLFDRVLNSPDVEVGPATDDLYRAVDSR